MIIMLTLLGCVIFFIIRALLKHRKNHSEEERNIRNSTEFKELDEWKKMPAAQRRPDLIQEVEVQIIKTKMATISMMKLPEMIYLCERALSFPSLQFEIKQKIKEFIEKEYKFLEERRQNKSSDIADYLKGLAQYAVRVGATGLAIDITKLEGYYRPSEFVIRVLEKVEV